jgi:hypothetical protein
MCVTISLLLLLAIGDGDAQRKNFAEKFENSIISLKSSKSYVSVLTQGSKIKPDYSIYLFDKSGNKILEKTNSKSWIINLEQSELFNCLVVVEQGYEGTQGVPGKPETIIAYDIKSGNEVWRCLSNAGDFSISPGGQYLMTQEIAFDRKSPFEIINLKDGKKWSPKSPVHQPYYSAWIDSERIVIVSYEKQRNPAFKSFEDQLREKMKKRDSLIDRIGEMKNTASIKEGEKKTRNAAEDSSDLRMRQERLALVKKEYTEVFEWEKKNRTNEMIPSTGKIAIYDVEKDKVEIQKEMYANDGQPIILSGAYSGFSICLDGQMNIFVQNAKELLKFDDKLNLLWSIKDVPLSMKKVKVGDDIYFMDGNYVIEGKSGQVGSLKELQKKHESFSFERPIYGDFNLTRKEFEINDGKSVRVDYVNKTIEFQGKEN